MAMQPWMLTKLSDISNGEAEADGTDVERMLASIRDPSMPLYDRGLCCAALGATIKLRRSRTVLRDISIPFWSRPGNRTRFQRAETSAHGRL